MQSETVSMAYGFVYDLGTSVHQMRPEQDGRRLLPQEVSLRTDFLVQGVHSASRIGAMAGAERISCAGGRSAMHAVSQSQAVGRVQQGAVDLPAVPKMRRPRSCGGRSVVGREVESEMEIQPDLGRVRGDAGGAGRWLRSVWFAAEAFASPCRPRSSMLPRQTLVREVYSGAPLLSVQWKVSCVGVGSAICGAVARVCRSAGGSK